MEQSIDFYLKQIGVPASDSLRPEPCAAVRKDMLPEYHSFREFCTEQVRFASIQAVIQAGWFLVGLYRTMHEHSLVYAGDLRDGAFFHAKTGHLYFVDSDRVLPENISPPEDFYWKDFQAPEVISEQAPLDGNTELWALGFYLFELFFHSGTPFRGHDSMLKVFLDPKEELLYMAQHAAFSEEENSPNYPVHGIQDRLIKYWKLYPQCLKDAFRASFGQGKKQPSARKDFAFWLDLLNHVGTEYLVCTCGTKGFSHTFEKTAKGNVRCPKCGNLFYRFESGSEHIYLSSGVRIYRRQIIPADIESTEIIGSVVENKQHPGVFGIKNNSGDVWKGIFPDGQEKEIKQGSGIPLWKGLAVTFPGGSVWRICPEEEKTAANRNASEAPALKKTVPDRETPFVKHVQAGAEDDDDKTVMLPQSRPEDDDDEKTVMLPQSMPGDDDDEKTVMLPQNMPGDDDDEKTVMLPQNMPEDDDDDEITLMLTSVEDEIPVVEYLMEEPF